MVCPKKGIPLHKNAIYLQDDDIPSVRIENNDKKIYLLSIVFNRVMCNVLKLLDLTSVKSTLNRPSAVHPHNLEIYYDLPCYDVPEVY